MDPFDVAQICLNGHVINYYAKMFPQHNKNFCDKCGAATITNCPNCNAEIQGQCYDQGAVAYVAISMGTYYKAPAFCPNCGKAYPWTKAKIQAAKELTQELEDISDNEKKILAQSIDEIIKDSPKTTLAATRFKKILSKTTKAIVNAFRELLVDIVSETAKKSLWP